MGENANRYFLMMTDHTEMKIFYSDQEYNNFLIEYSKNNKNPKNLYVYGNFCVLNSNKYSKVVKYTVYKKITLAYDLNQIDEFITNQVDNQENLKERFKTNVDGGKGKLYIGYMYDGQAKTLPIFYKKDKEYTNIDSIKKIIIDRMLEQAFLSKIWTNKKLNENKYRKKIQFHLEKIQVEYGKYVINKMVNTSGIEKAISDFVDAWCTRDEKINQRYVRGLGSIVKNIAEGKKEKEEEEKVTEIKGKSEEPQKKKSLRKKNDTENMEPLF